MERGGKAIRTILLLLCPVEECIDHSDGAVAGGGAGDRGLVEWFGMGMILK